MPSEQRRLAAIVSSDLAGYSRLMGEDESGTLNALRTVRRDIVDPRLRAHGGRIVKTMGDGLLVEFGSAVDAVRGMIDIQAAMAEFNVGRSDDRRIDFRIGVNVGDIVIEDDDIFGDGVNVAARLQELAPPGGICLSDFAHQQVRGRVDAEFSDLGEQRVKNIARPVRAWLARPSGPTAPAPNADVGPSAAAAGSPTNARGERGFRPTLAVLPFTNMGGDTDTGAFCDGLSEDIITALSRFRWMMVASRTSSFAYKDKSPDIRQAGRELGVRFVLEGSIRRAGRRVRINAQLIDCATGNHAWARRYDRELDDPFDLQDEIVRDVVAAIDYALWHTMVRAEGQRPNPLTSPLRAAAWHLTLLTPEDTDQAVACAKRALELNPRSIAASQYIVLAINAAIVCGWRLDLAADRAEMTDAAGRCVRLDAGDSLAQAMLALALVHVGERAPALAAARRSLSLNANSAQTMGSVSCALLLLGETEEGLGMSERVLDLVPNHYYRAGFLGLQALALRRLGDRLRGLAFARESAQLKPEVPIGHLAEATILADAGETEGARAAFARVMALRPDFNGSAVRGMLSPCAPAGSEDVVAALQTLGMPG